MWARLGQWAFDTIAWGKLMSVLRAYGVPEKMALNVSNPV